MYSDSDELDDEELEGEEDEIISTGTGRAILRLGAELVISECSKKDIKRRGQRNLTGGKNKESSGARW